MGTANLYLYIYIYKPFIQILLGWNCFVKLLVVAGVMYCIMYRTKVRMVTLTIG